MSEQYRRGWTYDYGEWRPVTGRWRVEQTRRESEL